MLLTIIVPVFNRQNGFEELLSGLFPQITAGGFEKIVDLVVIDDSSTPPVVIPESGFAIHLHRLKQNSGAPKARELGFQKSSGRFIHFHDSDDGFDEGWLSAIIKELEAMPELDILLTGRNDVGKTGSRYRYQKFFHRYVDQPERIKQRLVYRNCMGPLGGVTFSRRVLEQVDFRRFESCQDWQMYLDAVEYAKVLKSCPEIMYRFNVSGDDRISHNPAKKLIGHLQLSRMTAKKSVFGRNIRLFYLMTCRQHIINKQGVVLAFYKKHRIKFWLNYMLVSVYWRFIK